MTSEIEDPRTPERPAVWLPTPPTTCGSDETAFSPKHPDESSQADHRPSASPTAGPSLPQASHSNPYLDVLAKAMRSTRAYATTDHTPPLRTVLRHFSTIAAGEAEPDNRAETVMIPDHRLERTMSRLSEDLEHVDLRPFPVKRPLPDDGQADEDDVTYTGASPAGPNGQIRLAPAVTKRPRRDTSPESELQEIEMIGTRAVQVNLPRGCRACGCFCSLVAPNARGQGSGSTTLSAQVRGRLLELLLHPDVSLLDDLVRRDQRIRNWADIAQLVGARREDFDRVRHAASWMQDHLPGMKAAGRF